jgi:hypothetical protein
MGAQQSEPVQSQSRVFTEQEIYDTLPRWRQFIYVLRHNMMDFICNHRDIIFPERIDEMDTSFISKYLNLSDRKLFELIINLKRSYKHVSPFYIMSCSKVYIGDPYFNIHELNESFEKEHPIDTRYVERLQKMEEQVKAVNLKEYIAALEDKVKVLTEMVDEIQTKQENKYNLDGLI